MGIKENLEPFLKYYNFNIIACGRLYNQVIKASDTNEFKREVEKIVTEIKSSGWKDDHSLSLMEAGMKYFRFANMISNMILVSMSSYFEQYLKSCLTIFLHNVPSSLKSPKTITFEEIIDQQNYDRLKEYMIQKETDRSSIQTKYR